VSNANKQGIEEERKKKKIPQVQKTSFTKRTHGALSLFYAAMLSSLSSPALICDSTPDATVLALTGDVGEPVCAGGG
jgi:hypothetical protein